jgi:hypothetical protein
MNFLKFTRSLRGQVNSFLVLLFVMSILLTSCSSIPEKTMPNIINATEPNSPGSILTEGTPTPTPTQVSSPTSEILRPTVDSNLSPQNNASMVMENGTWVVKNSAGNVTATWDGATNKWTYNYENIQMQVGMADIGHHPDLPYTIREGITVTVPGDMLKPLSSAQLDPHPLVPSGYYGDLKETSQDGISTDAKIGVDYRGIILIDKNCPYRGKQVEEYAVVFTVQYEDHPDVINVLLVPVVNTKQGTLYVDLFPAGTTGIGTVKPGPTEADFLSILKVKNPIGRRMALKVYVSDTAVEISPLYSPDHAALVNAITNGQPIPSGLDIRLWGHDISMPHDLR